MLALSTVYVYPKIPKVSAFRSYQQALDFFASFPVSTRS
ncbi:hypothetical Protein YC6258_04039 [Gynuella sunshinyii YC6258]|uniref:Uncharacterized protein n=1 Tax=Gynuella sunshinyii YC6258 TaxID=1445510 RepID=A0A0C5V9N8_9GAMM|nr:hypothetical Protein YC6258_04039 [Gynuella sunshinyii YC6258]